MLRPRKAGDASRATTWLWALIALTLTLVAVSLVLARLAGTGHASSFIALPMTALGALMVRRARGNPIGWLLAGFGACVALYFDVGQYAVLAVRVHHDRLPLGRAAVDISSELWILVFLILPIVILLFPDGRLPRPWRRVLFAYVVVVAALAGMLLWAGAEQVSVPHLQITGQGQLANNPGTTGALVVPSTACLVAIPILWISFVVRQVQNWRRADAERREQLKWLTSGAVASLVGLASTVVLAQFQGSYVHPFLVVCLFFGLFSLPIALMVGILKYRLYEIDRIISRTVSYAILTGSIVALYAAVITLTTRAFGFSSSVAVAASTLGAAAIFNPLRLRLQRAIDRRFNRTRYDARAAAAAFAERLRTEMDLAAISDDLVAAVRATLEPTSVSLWLPGPGNGAPEPGTRVPSSIPRPAAADVRGNGLPAPQ